MTKETAREANVLLRSIESIEDQLNLIQEKGIPMPCNHCGIPEVCQIQLKEIHKKTEQYKINCLKKLLAEKETQLAKLK